MWIIHFILLLAASVTHTSTDPLYWEHGASATHTLIEASGSVPALDAVFTKDCLLVRSRKTERKAQLRQANFLVDLSEVARQQMNIRTGLRVLRETQPHIQSKFVTCPTCHFEYQQLRPVGYFDCQTLCHVERSQMIDNLDKLTEVLNLQSNEREVSFSKAWIRVQQDSEADGKYLVNYKLGVNHGVDYVPLFPINTLNYQPNVCYDHLDGKATTVSNCSELGADLKYWSNRLGQSKEQYWGKTHLQLLVRAVMASKFFQLQRAKLVNQTSTMADFQMQRLRFEIVLPRSRIAQQLSTEKATCICHRPVSQMDLSLIHI